MSGRRALLISAIVAVVVVPLLALALYIFVMFGGIQWPSGRLPLKQCRKEAARAQATVKAIFEYKHRVGLWPQRIADLGPDAIAKARAPDGWHYEWWWWGEWYYDGPGIGYFYADRYFNHLDCGATVQHGWHRFWQEGEELLDIPEPAIAAAEISGEGKTQSVLDELSRRIAREPKEIIHRQGRISLLYRLGRFAEARDECHVCITAFPDKFWPRVALAYVEAESGRLGKAADALRREIEANPTFQRYLSLALFYEQHGKPENAVAAMGEALGCPLAGDEEDSFLPEAIACTAATYAYRRKALALALKVCDAWEELGENLYCVEQSYHALRAAAHLALGEFDRADASLREAVKAETGRGLWIETTPALRTAVESRDQSFHDPSFGRTFLSDPFIPYE